MIVTMTVLKSVKIYQVLTILHQLICRAAANFGTQCSISSSNGTGGGSSFSLHSLFFWFPVNVCLTVNFSS